MINVVYWSSKTGNTQYFCSNLPSDWNVLKLSNIGILEKPLLDNEKFFIIVPTYADNDGKHAVPKAVINFVKACEANGSINNLVGIVGTGNRNFGEYFGYAADVVSSRTQKPVIFKFELRGTPDEVSRCVQIMTKIMKDIKDGNSSN